MERNRKFKNSKTRLKKEICVNFSMAVAILVIALREATATSANYVVMETASTSTVS